MFWTLPNPPYREGIRKDWLLFILMHPKFPLQGEFKGVFYSLLILITGFSFAIFQVFTTTTPTIISKVTKPLII